MSENELKISPPSFSNLSVPYLQFKFKLSHSAAKTVFDVFSKLNLDEIWNDVTKNPPTHKKVVIAHGKSLALKDNESFDTYLAYLDMRYGWMNSETNQSLYVTHWMPIQKQEVENNKKGHKKKKNIEDTEGNYGPPT